MPVVRPPAVRPPAASRRRTTPMVALALGVVLAGAAGTAAIARSDDGPAAVSADVTGRPSMAAEEVPDEVLAPEQLGDRSVASFSAFLDTVRGFSHGAPAPRPPDLAGLLERTSTSASGTVAAVSLELGTDRLGELQASRIDLVVDLRLDEVVEADARTDAVRWVRTVWSGDPVLGEQLVERFRAELGEGPVGARAVLFGNVVDTGDGPVLATFDGLVEDASGAARMSLVLSEPDDVLPSVDAAVEELTS